MSLGLLTSALHVTKRVQQSADPVIQSLATGMVSLVKPGTNYAYLTQRKTRLELIRLSAVVCGIELCYAAETAFVSPTLLKLGVPVSLMTLVWCLSPLLGIILVPFSGSLSDRCNSKYGRRRPFIFTISIGIIIGLILVPNGKALGLLLGDKDISINQTAISNFPNDSGQLFNYTNSNSTLSESYFNIFNAFIPRSQENGVILTVLGVVLLDLCCDAAQSPSRAYLLDVSVPEDHPTGLTTFTIMAGLGGCIGYVMGGINWHSGHTGMSLEGHIRLVFSVVMVTFLLCLCLTVTSFKEIPLQKMGLCVEELQNSKRQIAKQKYTKFTNEDSDTEKDEIALESIIPYYGATTNEKTIGNINKANQNELHDMSSNTNSDDMRESKETLVGISNFSILLNEIKLSAYLISIIKVPKSLCILCLANLCCWMSLVCYSLYFTDFVGQEVFGGDPTAPKGHHLHTIYNDGVRLGSIGMALYSLSCAIYSMFVEKLVICWGAKAVYIGGQLVYSLGMVVMAATRHQVTVILLSPTAGIMYATLFTMPYMLVAHYHTKGHFSEKDSNYKIRGLGTDIAIVSSMVFIAQFMLSAFVGSIIKATESTITVIVAAAILSLLGAITATQVSYFDL